MVSKAKAVAVASPAAPGAVALLAVGLGAYFLAGNIVPALGGLVGKGLDELKEGTGDFVDGVFNGADAELNLVGRYVFSSDPDTVVQIGDTPEGVSLGAAPAPFDPLNSFGLTSYSTGLVDGELTVMVDDAPTPSPLPGPNIYQFIEASTAQKLGSAATDEFLDFVSPPEFITNIGEDLVDELKAVGSFMGRLF